MGAAAMVSGVRAIHEYVALFLVKLRDEYRNAISNECEACFSLLAGLPADTDRRIPRSDSGP
jgi:hypothetical protein